MEGQLEKERSGGLGEEGVGPHLPGRWLWGETGVGVQGAGAERGSMITQGQSSCQTGGSLVGPANPPNYGGPGRQPRKRGAILTPRGEGLASQSLDFNRCLTSPPNRDGSWQDFRPEGRWESLTKKTNHRHWADTSKPAGRQWIEGFMGAQGEQIPYHRYQVHRSNMSPNFAGDG